MSDTKTVEQIEKKHALVEKEVAELKELVSKLSGGDAQLLQQLKDLKEILLAEKHEIELSLAEKAKVHANTQYTNNIQIIKERDALKNENDKLKYRVKILVRELEKEEAKH